MRISALGGWGSDLRGSSFSKDLANSQALGDVSLLTS